MLLIATRPYHRLSTAHWLRRASVLGIACGLLLAGSARTASAADPAVSECLRASSASLTAANEHKLRAERAELLICAQDSCPPEIRKECLRRVEQVNASIPTVVFEVTDARGNDVSAIRLTMDGELLAERLDGTALAVDPGEHEFVFESPQVPTLTRRFVLRAGEKDRRIPIRLEGPGAAGAASAPTQATGTASDLRPPPQSDPGTDRSSSTQQTLGWIALGTGAVGLSTWALTGALALSKKGAIDEDCPKNTCSTSVRDEASEYNRLRTVSTIGFFTGIAAAGAGLALLLTAPEAAPRSGGIRPWVGLTSAGVTGTFQ